MCKLCLGITPVGEPWMGHLTGFSADSMRKKRRRRGGEGGGEAGVLGDFLDHRVNPSRRSMSPEVMWTSRSWCVAVDQRRDGAPVASPKVAEGSKAD